MALSTRDKAATCTSLQLKKFCWVELDYLCYKASSYSMLVMKSENCFYGKVKNKTVMSKSRF